MVNINSKDPGKGHFYVSLVKSVLRIAAGGALVLVGGPIAYAGWLLIGAEALGILDELV